MICRMKERGRIISFQSKETRKEKWYCERKRIRKRSSEREGVRDLRGRENETNSQISYDLTFLSSPVITFFGSFLFLSFSFFSLSLSNCNCLREEWFSITIYWNSLLILSLVFYSFPFQPFPQINAHVCKYKIGRASCRERVLMSV